MALSEGMSLVPTSDARRSQTHKLCPGQFRNTGARVDSWHSGASSGSIKDSGFSLSLFDAPPRPQAYMTECESPRTSRQNQA